MKFQRNYFLMLRRICPCCWLARVRLRALSRAQTCRICAGVAAVLSVLPLAGLCTDAGADGLDNCPSEQLTINEFVINLPACPPLSAAGFTPVPKVMFREALRLIVKRLSPKNVRVTVL